jgi:hypothetical protein
VGQEFGKGFAGLMLLQSDGGCGLEAAESLLTCLTCRLITGGYKN